MQRQALSFLRGLGNRLRVQSDEAVLRMPRFARELDPEPLQEFQEAVVHPRQADAESSQAPSNSPGERIQEEKPSTSYNLPDLRADVEQQRYPVSALLTLVRRIYAQQYIASLYLQRAYVCDITLAYELMPQWTVRAEAEGTAES